MRKFLELAGGCCIFDELATIFGSESASVADVFFYSAASLLDTAEHGPLRILAFICDERWSQGN